MAARGGPKAVVVCRVATHPTVRVSLPLLSRVVLLPLCRNIPAVGGGTIPIPFRDNGEVRIPSPFSFKENGEMHIHSPFPFEKGEGIP